MSVTVSPIYIPSSDVYAGNPTDYCGFHFGDKSSEDLGIVRVSNSSRYKDDLMPTVENKTVSVPGGHGSYFFGSYYRERIFSINFAFDSLTELQIRELKRIFSPCNELKELWFDERPYVAYKVKINNPILISYICFDEGDEHRLYKGEGTISLQCFNPFGYSRFKYINDFRASHSDKIKDDDLETYINEWKDSSRFLNFQGTENSFVNGVCTVYNPGDLETDFNIILKLDEVENGDIYLRGSSTYPWMRADLGTLCLKNIQAESETDAYIRINSKLNIIEGLDYNKESTGTLYNKYIVGGDFFRIPVNYDKDDEQDRTKIYLTTDLKSSFALAELEEIESDELREDKDYTLEIKDSSLTYADFNFNYKYL